MLDVDIPVNTIRGRTNIMCKDACSRYMTGAPERGHHYKQGRMEK